MKTIHTQWIIIWAGFFFSHHMQVLPNKSLKSCQPHRAKPNVHMHQPVWARMRHSGTECFCCIAQVAVHRNRKHKDSFSKHANVLEVPGGLPTRRKGLCCIRNSISGWSRLDACFGLLLVFCWMNSMRGKKREEYDGLWIKTSFNAGHSSLCPVFFTIFYLFSLDLKCLLVELKGYVKPCFCFKHKNFERFWVL